MSRTDRFCTESGVEHAEIFRIPENGTFAGPRFCPACGISNPAFASVNPRPAVPQRRITSAPAPAPLGFVFEILDDDESTTSPGNVRSNNVPQPHTPEVLPPREEVLRGKEVALEKIAQRKAPHAGSSQGLFPRLLGSRSPDHPIRTSLVE